MLRHRSLLLALAGVVVASAAAAQPTLQLSGSFVVISAGPLARAGSFRACVMANVGRGLSLNAALALCNFDDPGWDRGDALNPLGIAGPGGSRVTGTGSVNCASASVNPAVAAGGWRTPEEYKQSSFYGIDEDFTTAVDEYQQRVAELYAAQERADKAEAAFERQSE